MDSGRITRLLRRVRRFISTCHIKLRPVRNHLRNPANQALMVKCALFGTVAYFLLYTSFYIMSRHNYLLGFHDVSSDSMMEQYERDLGICWHINDGSMNFTVNNNKTEVLSEWPSKLSYIKLVNTSSKLMTSRSQSGLLSGIRRGTKQVLVLPGRDNQIKTLAADALLDAGSCVLQSRSASTSLPLGQTLRISTDYAGLRCLPSFMIIGAMKCGTGELMKWLQLHPKLALGTGAGDKREIHYFTSTMSNNNKNKRAASSSATVRPSSVSEIDVGTSAKLLEYAHFFPEFTATQAREMYTFEKSPDYIRDHGALRTIRSLLPSVKLVLLLRNPAHRALSEFSHHCRHGRYARITRNVFSSSGADRQLLYKKGDIVRTDIGLTERRNNQASANSSEAARVLPKGSFEALQYPCTAADAESYFLRPHGAQLSGIAHVNHSSSSTSSGEEEFVPEIQHGFYAHQLAALLDIFPVEQVLVLLQEDMYRHTFRTLRSVEEFLRLPCFDYRDFVLRQPLLGLGRSSTGAAAVDPLQVGSLLIGAGQGQTTAGDQTQRGQGSAVETEDDDGMLVVTQSATRGIGAEEGQRVAGSNAQSYRPPKRVPLTVAEQVAHYRTELRQFLASWKGSEDGADGQSVHLYDQVTPSFRLWLEQLYAGHNKRLALLLHSRCGMATFSEQHLASVGWSL